VYRVTAHSLSQNNNNHHPATVSVQNVRPNVPVLRDFSLHIVAGQTTAVAGSSSSLIKQHGLESGCPLYASPDKKPEHRLLTHNGTKQLWLVLPLQITQEKINIGVSMLVSTTKYL
jgi:hypothetical protein